jgi:hypothetical protein
VSRLASPEVAADSRGGPLPGELTSGLPKRQTTTTHLTSDASCGRFEVNRLHSFLYKDSGMGNVRLFSTTPSKRTLADIRSWATLRAVSR